MPADKWKRLGLVTVVVEVVMVVMVEVGAEVGAEVRVGVERGVAEELTVIRVQTWTGKGLPLVL